MSEDAGKRMVIEYAPPLPWYRQVDVAVTACSFVAVLLIGAQLWSYVQPVEITLTRASEYAIVSEDGQLVLRVRTPMAMGGVGTAGPLSDHWVFGARFVQYPVRWQGRGRLMSLRRIVVVPHAVVLIVIVAPIVLIRRRRRRAILSRLPLSPLAAPLDANERS